MSTAFTEKGLNATFTKAFEAWPAAYKSLCMFIPSTNSSEKYAFGGAPPAMREFLGPRQGHRISEATYTVLNKKWESTLEIPQDDIEDDNTGILNMRVMEMAEYAGRHPDELVLGTLVDAAYAATCYDGQYFFDTDHAEPEGLYTTSQDNDKTGTAATGTTPTVLEFIGALKTVIAALRAYKDSNGKPVNGYGKIYLEADASYEFLFAQLMEASHFSYTAATASEDNYLKNMIGGYFINPHTSNTDRFRAYLLDGPFKPYLFQSRKPLTTQYIRADNKEPDNLAFMTDSNFFGTKARYNAGYAQWRKACSYIFT